ncbi:MAG TPA: PAS domain S-box protein [Anaeromyxobacteraceae bacterium]|jgi:PAS domain S-box-containing protein
MSASAFTQEVALRVVEGTPDGVLVCDRDGIIRAWNAGAERIFGFGAAEAVGRSMDIIIPERLRPRHWEGWKKTMATGATRYGAGDLLAVPALHKDGRTVSIEFSIQVLLGGDGKPAGSAAVVRDVTARFQRDKETKAKVRELEAKLGGK